MKSVDLFTSENGPDIRNSTYISENIFILKKSSDFLISENPDFFLIKKSQMIF